MTAKSTSKAQKDRDRRTCVHCGRVFPTIKHLLAHQTFNHRKGASR